MSSNEPIYQPLSFETEEIRLLQLDRDHAGSSTICSLKTFKLAETPPYQALSYCWGDSKILRPIKLNGQPFQVTANLFLCLERLNLRDDYEWLWIDALCIDQQNIEEREYQVPLMEKIYRLTQRVIIWLGSAANDSGLAIELINRWGYGIKKGIENDPKFAFNNRLKSALPYVKDPFDEASWKAFWRLLGREYWARVWTLQEVVLANSWVVICGDSEVDFQLFYNLFVIATQFGVLNADGIVPAQVAARSVHVWDTAGIRDNLFDLYWVENVAARVSLLTIKIYTQRKGHIYQPDLLHLIGLCRRLEASNPRDHIYGVLGLLSSQPFHIKPDYRLGVAEIYANFTIEFAQKLKSLAVLQLSGIGMDLQQTVSMSGPSWVPDYSKRPGVLNLEYTPFTKFNAARGISPVFKVENLEILKAYGIISDEVTEISTLYRQDQEIQFSSLWEWVDFASIHGAAEHPCGIPWRQAFFRTLICDDLTVGDGNSFFLPNSDGHPPHEQEFPKLIEGFFTLMRWSALSKVLPLVPLTGAMDIQTLLDIDYEKVIELYNLLEEERISQEVYYWVTNTSLSSEDLRSERLSLFCGPTTSPNRIHWGYIEYARQWHTYNTKAVGRRIGEKCAHRKLFIAKKGYLGLGPPGIQSGDKICVLFGCSVPLIIRPHKSGFVIVGDAYVYGMMQGEMIEELGGRKSVLEELSFL